MILLLAVLPCVLPFLADAQSYGQNYGQNNNRRVAYAQQSPYFNRAIAQAQMQQQQHPQWAQPQRSPQQGPTPYMPIPSSQQQTAALAPWSQQASAHPQFQYQANPAPSPQWVPAGGVAPGAAAAYPQGHPFAGQGQPMAMPQPGQPQPWQLSPQQQQQMAQQQQQQQQMAQQPQQGAPNQPEGYNIPPTNVLVEQAPPPKVIFLPPEVHYGPPPKELVEQQTKTVLMCKGTPHTVMGDQQYYSCCNEKLYYWKTEVCEDGVVKPSAQSGGGQRTDAGANQQPPKPQGVPAAQPPPPPPAPAPVQAQAPELPAVTTLNCNGSTFMVASSERINYACCGRTLFDLRTSTCSLDLGSTTTTTTVAPSNFVAMRQQPICPLNFLCCDGYTPIPNAEEKYQCCPGAGPYDTTSQQCVPI